ncbi:MAG: hypothetical protein WC048_03850 [Rhizobium sp.]
MASRKIYEALVEGATAGLGGDELFGYILSRHPKTTSRKIVHAALLSLSDPALSDRNILHTIFALAIKHRLKELQSGDTGKESDKDTPDRYERTATAARTAHQSP